MKDESEKNGEKNGTFKFDTKSELLSLYIPIITFTALWFLEIYFSSKTLFSLYFCFFV